MWRGGVPLALRRRWRLGVVGLSLDLQPLAASPGPGPRVPITTIAAVVAVVVTAAVGAVTRHHHHVHLQLGAALGGWGRERAAGALAGRDALGDDLDSDGDVVAAVKGDGVVGHADRRGPVHQRKLTVEAVDEPPDAWCAWGRGGFLSSPFKAKFNK